MEKLSYNNSTEKAIDVSDFAKIRKNVCEILDSNKSENIVLINLKPQFAYDLWFIVATALSSSHLKKLSMEIIGQLRDDGILAAYKPNEIDYSSGWVAIDYGELIVHILLKDKRDFYSLEDLWKTAIIENYSG